MTEKSNRFTAVSARRAAAAERRAKSGTGARWRQAKHSRPEYAFPEPPLDLGEVELVYVDEPEVTYATEETTEGIYGPEAEITAGEDLAEKPTLPEPPTKGVKKVRTVRGIE